MTRLPILYTFRRCPFAIRARLAIATSGIAVTEREVELGAKPKTMLDLSPKGTVPVLQLADGTVLEQSLDIMRWALNINDPESWLDASSDKDDGLIDLNDGAFKHALDRYKYPARFPAFTAVQYREEGSLFLAELESRLARHSFLTSDRCRMTDAAIVPFVRQFAAVDRQWFDQSHFPHVVGWLDTWLGSGLFRRVMAKQDTV